ncbi:AarF/ABC1/UbiB kinase family protein [Algivirga pacifica]|uniref:AarF/ABC1/UbiB kinase family protein n=1 Tax=Algivirga pacifica TaxID=1162670 RepID=A0ABP9CWD4_9BACT
MFFDRTVRNIQRIQQVIVILLEYGFEDVVTNTKLNRFVKEGWTRRNRPITAYSRWERVRMVIEELGPTFIKFAQLLSNRPDLLPKGLIREFEKLQDSVPPIDVDLARHIVETETGRSIDELFVYFDEVPLGSASIGQVHRARLLSGEDVVIKVQRPEADKQMRTDLALLMDIIRLMENFFKNNGILNPIEVVQAFEKSMNEELDYRIEIRNLINFKKAYEKDPHLYVPKAYKELSTRKILTMEFVSGCKITDKERLLEWGLEPKHVVKHGLQIYLKQIFEMGYFHADPHPGNILVRPDGKIILLDFGMIGKMSRYQRYAFANFMVSLSNGDAKGVSVYLRKLSHDGEVENARELESDLSELVDDFIVYGGDDTEIGDIVSRLQKVIYRHRLSVAGVVFLILRALTILDGIGRKLYSDFEIIPVIRPYGAKLLREQFTTKNISSDLYYSFLQFSSLLYNLPLELRFILKKARTGKLFFNHHIEGLEQLTTTIDQVVSRLNVTLILLAVFLGSSIVTASDSQYLARNTWGIPYVSMVGYVISILLVILLSILKNFRKND